MQVKKPLHMLMTSGVGLKYQIIKLFSSFEYYRYNIIGIFSIDVSNSQSSGACFCLPLWVFFDLLRVYSDHCTWIG